MNRTLGALIVGASALLGGCVADGPFYVDAAFTDAERLEVARAAEMWTAAGAPVDIVWDAALSGHETDRRIIVRAGHSRALELESVFQTDGTTGYYNGTGLIVVDMDRIRTQSDILSVVVAHEMGHALGLGHVGAGDALMSERRGDSSPVELTMLDVQECRRVGACATEGAGGR